MEGEKNLAILIATMKPILHEGEYVFATVSNTDAIPREIVLCEMKEEEGITLVLLKDQADKLGVQYSYIASWITLRVHSSLAAVGLTAAFATALARNGISCNVIAGFYHDHIFVDSKDGKKAYDVLIEMTLG